MSIPPDPVWYPFTQMSEFKDHSPLTIAAAEGCWLIDSEGRRYLDGVSSLWANVHGHRHPRIDAAIKSQLDKVAHTTLLGLSHPGAIELGRRLVALAPPGLTRVFYSDCGAAAVEIALKMAYQYWQHRGATRRRTFLRLTEAYHGDTVGAVSVGGINLFHERFRPLLFPTVPVPAPHLYRHPYGPISDAEAEKRFFAEAERIVAAHSDTACAFVIEPLIQGAAGMIVHPPGYLRHIREITKRYGVLLIADEVAVGFGRTGKMFACEWEEVKPDILCLGKGISGGYLPLAATLATEEIFAAFLGDFTERKTFFHGHTYTGNPLACAAALASLELFEEERTLAADRFGPKAERYAAGMRALAGLPHVGSARWRGMMGGVELVQDRASKQPYPFAARRGHQVILAARRRGVILRPLGDVVVILPPLAISLEELDILFRVVEEAIQEVIA